MREWKSVNLNNSGYVRSVQDGESCIDNGIPCPWYSYAAVYFLEERITKSMDIFEFGAGHSSLWYRKRCRWLHSVEHDKNWIDYLKSVDGCLQIKHRPLDMSYCEAIKPDNIFHKGWDIIVLDSHGDLFEGRGRFHCARHSMKYIKPNGVFILDNSDSDKNEVVYEYLLSKGYRVIDFFGQAPCNFVYHGTSIFYKSGNVLGI